MVTQLDKSIGHIMAALGEKEILYNTIVVFISDNGAAPIGPTQNFGSNLPFRGRKGTPWEGGLRSLALIWHLDLVSHISHELFHVTDWLPTLVAAGRGNATDVDGVNQWNTLKENNDTPSDRNCLLLSIDDLNGWAAIRDGDYKFIVGDLKQEAGEAGEYHGKELLELRLEEPVYNEVLADCETKKVFLDFLNREIDTENVVFKRNESIVAGAANEDETKLCVPSPGK